MDPNSIENKTYLKIKEILDSKLFDLETNFNKQIENIKELYDQKINSYNSSISSFTNRLEINEKKTNENQIKLELQEGLVTFKKETSETLITHDIRISSLYKELRESCHKYDKIFIENLFIPGIIGEFCRFKNMRDYTEYVLTNMQSLLNYKEKSLIEMKSNKERLDSSSKMINSQFENSEKEMKAYMKSLIENSESTFKYQCETLDNRMSEIKFDNIRYAVNFQKEANELKLENEKLSTLKKDIFDQLENSIKEYKDTTFTTVDQFDKIKGEFDSMKIKFTDLSEFIKDVRFRRNLNTQQVNRKEVKELANNITYEKKKKHKKGKSKKENQVIVNPPLSNNELSDDEDSVKIEEKDEIESYVKKYINGSLDITKSISKSPGKTCKIMIKEPNQNVDQNIFENNENSLKDSEKDKEDVDKEINPNSIQADPPKKKFKDKFPQTNVPINRNESKDKSMKFQSSSNTAQISSSAKLREPQNNFLLFQDKFSELKKELNSKVYSNDKRINEIENNYKVRFEQLLSQIKNFIPLNMNWMNSPKTNMEGINYNSNMNLTQREFPNYNNMGMFAQKDNSNIINNSVSVNIMDPTIIFKSNRSDKNQSNKKIANPLKNNLKTMNNNYGKEVVRSYTINENAEKDQKTRLRANSFLMANSRNEEKNQVFSKNKVNNVEIK